MSKNKETHPYFWFLFELTITSTMNRIQTATVRITPARENPPPSLLSAVLPLQRNTIPAHQLHTKKQPTPNLKKEGTKESVEEKEFWNLSCSASWFGLNQLLLYCSLCVIFFVRGAFLIWYLSFLFPSLLFSSPSCLVFSYYSRFLSLSLTESTRWCSGRLVSCPSYSTGTADRHKAHSTHQYQLSNIRNERNSWSLSFLWDFAVVIVSFFRLRSWAGGGGGPPGVSTITYTQKN